MAKHCVYGTHLDECIKKFKERFPREIFRNCQVNFTSVGNMSEVSMHYISDVIICTIL